MRTTSFFVMLMLSSAAFAQRPVDLEKEKAELLKVHQTDREAHFKTDVEMILLHSADEFISVSSGRVERSTRRALREFFEGYFKNAKYYEWDDLEPPVVRISNDASMAWMIVRTKVSRTQKDDAGAERRRQFVYAGIMTYEKQNGKWVRIANVSTFE